MNNKIIKNIFIKNNLEHINIIEKINIGFTNKIYSINNKYILKICEDIGNEINFEREVFLYDFFSNKLPVPKVLIYDNSKELYEKQYMIYYKIEGDNLYSIWHLISIEERKNIIIQLCNMMKIINTIDYNGYLQKFNVSFINWENYIISEIQSHLKILRQRKILKEDFINSIERYIKFNKYMLEEEKIALVHGDLHFDNILVKNNNIVGILDFEATKLSSIDFALDVFKRMVEKPTKYMSEESKKYCKKDDYKNLLLLIKNYYPDLFNFKYLEQRLNFYVIEHDLEDLIYHKIDNELIYGIAKIVGYKFSII